MCPDGGAAVLSLKDQPIVDEEKSLGEVQLLVLGLSHFRPPRQLASSPHQAPPTFLNSCRRPQDPALGPSNPCLVVEFQGSSFKS